MGLINSSCNSGRSGRAWISPQNKKQDLSLDSWLSGREWKGTLGVIYGTIELFNLDADPQRIEVQHLHIGKQQSSCVCLKCKPTWKHKVSTPYLINSLSYPLIMEQTMSDMQTANHSSGVYFSCTIAMWLTTIEEPAVPAPVCSTLRYLEDNTFWPT